MKIQHLIYSIGLSSLALVAIAEPSIEYLECLHSKTSAHFVLVAATEHSPHLKLMYYPYLKPIALHYIKTEAVEMAEDRPFEQHIFYNEKNGKQNTGQYEVIQQGARIYAVIYTTQQSGKATNFQNYLTDEQRYEVNQLLIPHKLQCIS